MLKKSFPCIYFSKYEKYPKISTNGEQKIKTVNIYIQGYGSFTMASSFEPRHVISNNVAF